MERLPGFRDFYPEPLPHADAWSADARQYLFDKWRSTARRYGFREYDAPPLEALELFTAKSGEEIIGQLYNFTDKGGREISLRPEMTPSLARMAAAHERNYRKPMKWFAIPQLFRYERHQKGRMREHFQLNADIIGETDVAADAELIALLIDLLRTLGLTSNELVIRLSSRNAWHDFFVRHTGKPEDEYAFYQIVDKLEREDPSITQQKLQALGLTMEQVKSFIESAQPSAELEAVMSNLQARKLRDYVKIDYGIIRGLAYYTGIVFEAFDKTGEQPRAIAGGGRYNNLVKLISGGKVDLPALGFGMGDVVIMDLLRAQKLLPTFTAGVEVFCIVQEESLRQQTLSLIEDLRWAGLVVDYSLTPAKPEKQFKRAQELKSVLTVALQSGAEGTLVARIRNLATREEKTLDITHAEGSEELVGIVKSMLVTNGNRQEQL